MVQLFEVACIANLVRTQSDALPARLLPALLVLVPTVSLARFRHRLEPQLRTLLMRRLCSSLFVGALVCEALAISGLVVGVVTTGQAGRQAGQQKGR